MAPALPSPRLARFACLPATLIAGALAIGATSALAQYKVVAPDGSVSYTDRPPVDTSNRVTPMSRSGRPLPNSANTNPPLPPGLREAAQKWPVTLYTAAECASCDAGRQWLAARGIPYTEKRIASDEDVQALDRIVGGRGVPALSIGAQPLRGFSEGEWASYLDEAGYPRESRLPRNWTPPPVTPLVERQAVAAPAPSPAPAPAPRAAEPAPAPGSIRF